MLGFAMAASLALASLASAVQRTVLVELFTATT
jgi:hypothetical protein